MGSEKVIAQIHRATEKARVKAKVNGGRLQMRQKWDVSPVEEATLAASRWI
jgi:hypothetical protein